MTGEIFPGPLLASYLARAPWLEFEDSQTVFDAALEMRQGRLLEGSHLHTEKTVRTLRFFGFEASGQALLDFDVRRDASGGHADLALGFDDFELRKGTAAEAVVGGTGLSLLATTRDLRAGGLPDDARIRIDLERLACSISRASPTCCRRPPTAYGSKVVVVARFGRCLDNSNREEWMGDGCRAGD